MPAPPYALVQHGAVVACDSGGMSVGVDAPQALPFTVLARRACRRNTERV
jgi:hypothetical protein